MVFKIERVSDPTHADREAPCKNATPYQHVTNYRLSRDIVFDENGKQIIQTTDKKETYTYWQIDIHTIEELIALQKEVDVPLIVENDGIVIYDGYIE